MPPPSPTGYWGTSDATIDFCEPNYEVSHYVAEFWNTVTSIPIMLVGVFGVLLCRKQQLGAEQTACYTVVGVVGVGSIAFHATLLRTGQVLDELPMLWATTTLIYAACQHARDRRHRRRQHASVPSSRRLAMLGLALCFYALTAMCLYFANGFLVFILAYGLSVAALVVLALAIFLREQPPVGTKPRRILATAACTYAGGFLLLWLPAEVLCHHVPVVQRLPLHALFHLTSAAAPHLGLTAFALARFDDEPATSAPPSLLFGGLPAIDRKLKDVERMERGGIGKARDAKDR